MLEHTETSVIVCAHCSGAGSDPAGCECDPLYLCPGCQLMGPASCDLCAHDGLVAEGDLDGLAEILEGREFGWAPRIVADAQLLGGVA